MFFPIKVLFLNPLFWQGHFILMSSLFFLQMQYSLCGESNLASMFIYLYLFFTLLHIILTKFANTKALLLHGINLGIIVYQSIQLYIRYQHNWTLAFSIFFCICYLFYFLFLQAELKRCIYHPNFHPLDLGLRISSYIPVAFNELKLPSAVMTNLGLYEFVVTFPHPVILPKNVEVSVYFQGQIFQGKVRVATKMFDGQCYGLVLNHSEKDFFSTNSLADVFFILEKRAQTL